MLRVHSTVWKISLAASLLLASAIASPAEQDLYFPNDDASWETVAPEDVGWDTTALEAAFDVAQQRNSSGLLILHRGRIMAERYWEPADPIPNYHNFMQGRDKQGRAIEDVASVQKSVVSVMVGMAQERGYLAIDDPVSRYLGDGWTNAGAEQEQAITIRHLLSMNSGLDTSRGYEAPAGTRWMYNTPVYHRTMKVLSAATGLDPNTLTRQWITGPLGMEDSSWAPRTWVSGEPVIGFLTTTRDLARFGIMIRNGGKWKNETILADQDYFSAMLSPSQDDNPSYGYLWWLNGNEFTRSSLSDRERRDGQIMASAPPDLVAALGAMDRKLYIVPSLDLIITRLGSIGAEEGSSFNDAFWDALMKAAQR